MADNDNGHPSGFQESYLEDAFNPNGNNNTEVDDFGFNPLINYVYGDEDMSMFPSPDPVASPSVAFQGPTGIADNGNAADSHDNNDDLLEELFGPAPAAPAAPVAPAQHQALTFPQNDQGEHIEDEIVVAVSENPAPAASAPQGHGGHPNHFAHLNPFGGNQDPAINPNQQYHNPFDLNPQVPQHQPQYPLGPLEGQGNNNHHMYGVPSHGQFGVGQLGAYPNMHGLQQPAQGGLYGNLHGGQFAAPSPSNLYQRQSPSPNPYRSQSPSPNPYQSRGPSPNPPAQFNQAAQPVRPQHKIHHKRGFKDDATNDPTQIYSKPGPLASWGPDVEFLKEKVFQYYQRTAELRSGILLTREQIASFISGRGHPNRGTRKLTLWIQNTAAQSNHRYANGAASSKCRYKDCPGQLKTILKGFYRVAFDEHSDQTGTTYDPMHNAFYMHLHCFEELFDLGFLIHHGARNLNFEIVADDRNFPNESRNPASINRDHHRMMDTYYEWVNSHKDRADAINHQMKQGEWYTGLNPGPENIFPHPQRLGYALTMQHLNNEHKARADARNKRGGVHIGVHMGDLAKLMRLKKQQKDANRAVEIDDEEQWSPSSREGSPQPITRKRRTADDDDDDYVEPRAAKRSKQTHTYNNLGDSGNNNNNNNNPQPQVRATSPTTIVVNTQGRKRGADDADNDPSAESSAAAAKRSKQTHDYSNTLLRGPHRPTHRQRDISAAKMGDIYDVSSSDDDEYRPSPQPQQRRPRLTPSSRRPRTRQRSRDLGSSILDRLHQQPHLTRSSAHAIQSQLGGEPAHVQDQVLAAVPEETASLLAVPPPRQEPRLPDHLEARVERLNPAQRREVVAAVAREEKKAQVMGEKQRKVQSL